MVQSGSAQLGSLLSPVTVGRDDVLALASRRLDEVLAGHGQLLLISGEAGIGKTRVLGAISTLGAGRGLRVAKGELAPQDRDVMAASFLDLGRAMRRDPAFGTMGSQILEVAESRLTAAVARRRDLVMEIVDLIAAAKQPTMLAFEDLQWADDLSLETLTEVARHTRELPVLLVGAYRSNEAIAGSVLREWRSRLVTQRIAEEVRLGRLSRDETALMTSLILGTGLPAPRDVVNAVYARTDGVPLHVEELLSALGRERLADSRAVVDVAVPETLEDATLARVARLSPEAQAVARAGTVLGRSFVPTVLAGIMNSPVEALDDPIQELVEHDVLDQVEGGGAYDFRHQLLRDALYRSVPAGDRRRFHARAAEFGAKLEGASEIHASMHYERAGLTEDAFRTALVAAQQAMAMSSHREAFDLFRRAVDNMPAALSDEERVRVYLGFSDAAANTDRSALSADYATRARDLAARIGDSLARIEALANLAEVAAREGESVTSRRDGARQLLNEAEAAPEGELREIFRIIGHWTLGQAEEDGCRFGDARAQLSEALEVARRANMPRYVRTTEGLLAKLDIIEGRVEDGLARMWAMGKYTRENGSEDWGVHWFDLATRQAVRVMDYRGASVGIKEGLRYAESVEQSFCGHWLQCTEALVSWADGRWDDASRQGGQAVSDPGSTASRAVARWAIGYVEAGRGRRREAEEHLRPAVAWARAAERLDMLLPAQWGLAEAALHGGDPDNAASLADEALRLAREGGEWMTLAPFAVTGVRAHQAAGRPAEAVRYLDQLVRAIGPGAEVARAAIEHATGLVRLAENATGIARDHLEAAIQDWDSRGRRWEALWARLDLASTFLRTSRFAEAVALLREVDQAAEAMGSEPLRVRAEQLVRIARGRGEEVEPWHPLTTREFEVARRIAEGLTNAEIGKLLVVSPKTVSSHVEHILAKLRVSRRAEIAAWTISVMTMPTPATEAAPTR